MFICSNIWWLDGIIPAFITGIFTLIAAFVGVKHSIEKSHYKIETVDTLKNTFLKATSSRESLSTAMDNGIKPNLHLFVDNIQELTKVFNITKYHIYNKTLKKKFNSYIEQCQSIYKSYLDAKEYDEYNPENFLTQNQDKIFGKELQRTEEEIVKEFENYYMSL